MVGARRAAAGLLLALGLWSQESAAQTLLIDDVPVQERFTHAGATYVSLPVLLRAMGFDWSVRGREILLREGAGQGTRIRAERLVLRRGDRALEVTGIRRGDAVYVPLVEVAAYLGYRVAHDAGTNTTRVVAAGEGPPGRVRVSREVAAGPVSASVAEECDIGEDAAGAAAPVGPATLLASLRYLDPGLPRPRQVTMEEVARLAADRLRLPLAVGTVPDAADAPLRIRRPGTRVRTERAPVAQPAAAPPVGPTPLHMVDQLRQPGGYFYAPTGAGGISLARSFTNWRKTWHAIVPGRFKATPGTDLFLYDRLTGEAGFYANEGGGNFPLLKGYANLGRKWDVIVPGRFSEGVHALFTDLFFYDRQAGRARFYRTDGNGNLELLKQHDGLADWDVILPGDWGGSYHTDLFFYSRRRGEAKFYRTDGKGNLALLRTRQLGRSWDLIVPGEFGGDGHTDLLLYRRITGDARFYIVSENGALAQLRAYDDWSPTWDVIVPGAFGGGSTTDLFLYDRRAGTARFLLTDAAGGISARPLQTGLRPTWFAIVPGEYGFSGGADLLFYDNHYRIPIHAVRVADDDGSRAAAITPEEVQRWVDRANDVFGAAGIVFEFDEERDWETMDKTVLNNLGTASNFEAAGFAPAARKPASDASKAVAELIGNDYPGKIVVFFRHGPATDPTGGGFSGYPSVGYGSFVAMPGFATRTHIYYQNPSHPDHGARRHNIKLLAHELGHYLGLPHTFGVQLEDENDDGVVDTTDLVSWLSAKGGTPTEVIDGDRDRVRDTPGDVGRAIFLDAGLNPADLDGEIAFQPGFLLRGADPIVLNPDRHNVMAYGMFDDYQRLSPDQVRRVREWLHEDHRKHLIAGQ